MTDRKGITAGLGFNLNGFSITSQHLIRMYLTTWQFSELKEYSIKMHGNALSADEQKGQI